LVLREWVFERLRGCWTKGRLRASVSFVLAVPRDGSLLGYTPELLVDTYGKAGYISVMALKPREMQRWHKLTGLPLLKSRSHLLFRPRQLRHARYARMGSAADDREDTTRASGSGAVPAMGLAVFGLEVWLFASS
jgi:hypothetical protein